MTSRVLLRVLVTVAFLAWFVHQFGPAAVLEVLQRAPRECAVAAAVSIVVILTMALRWQLLLRALNLSPRFREVIRATFAGYLAGTFLPSVSGDVVKIACLARGRSTAVPVAVSTVVDRWFGLVALVGLGLAAAIVHRPSGRLGDYVGGIYLAVAAALLLAVGLALVARGARPGPSGEAPAPGRCLGRLSPVVGHVGAAVNLYAGRKAVLLQALGVAVVSQLISILIYYGLALAVGATSGVLDFLYGVPLVTLATVLPISVGGIGVGEWTFVQVFTDLGMSRDAALTVSVLNLVARIAGGLLGGAVPLFLGRS